MDPITFVADTAIASDALIINANDLATMGATPRWFLVTLLFPTGIAVRQIARTFSQLGAACKAAGVLLCGGHTEITTAVQRPVAVGCLFGECSPKRLVTSAGARVGDLLLLTKGIPIEAITVLARERPGELRRRYGPSFVKRCLRYALYPGISVVPDARAALAAGGVHAMHDPTEGGISTALYELAEAAGVGLHIQHRAIQIVPEGARLCEDYGLNPLGTLASGALLISAGPAYEGAIIKHLARRGIPAARIGAVVSRREGVRLAGNDGRLRPLPRFSRDELARLLE